MGIFTSDCVDLRFISINFVLFYQFSVFKRFWAQSFTNHNGEGRQVSMEGKLFPEDCCKFEVVILLLIIFGFVDLVIGC